MPDATLAQARNSTNHLRIVVINVLIKNREDTRLWQLVQVTQPDRYAAGHGARCLVGAGPQALGD
ncbi:hypothetical protein [Hymenobacter sp. GOD-10R]|uniref:hypothetical protein n=1 Tax=Hymenobacter sp. GOD-10R TaxID=3093922 RepID=UPI002D7835EF|nr:hypothetical protein [Hymenobacter sp. GOD-10R]WRQ31918.1 hypothetical protein SD425_29665 [Hymenobacter sp. GOD-10R]